MSEGQKSPEEVALMLTTCILGNDSNQPHTKDNILSIYAECKQAVKARPDPTTSERQKVLTSRPEFAS